MSAIAVRGALPEDDAELVRKRFVNADWCHVPFEDAEYYGRYPDRTARGLPSLDETYSTDFWKADLLTTNPIVVSCVDKILDIIDSVMSGDVSVDRDTVSLLAYRLGPGGHLRIHDDEYAADVGFIWYLSKGWKWDWGGLLLSLPENQPPVVEMPEFNKLVVLNHSVGVTHCVTSVERWARDDRYMLVGMMRCKK